MIGECYRECLFAAQAIGFCHSTSKEAGDLLNLLCRRLPNGSQILEFGTGVGAGISQILNVCLEKNITIISTEISKTRLNAIPACILNNPFVTILNNSTIPFHLCKGVGLIYLDCDIDNDYLNALVSHHIHNECLIVLDLTSTEKIKCIASIANYWFEENELVVFKKSVS